MATSAGPSKSPLSIVDLPLETQQQIIGYVGRRDLLTLQPLSRHCHALASTELYKNLDFHLTSSETDDHRCVASRIADALQTILASDHDYGKYIKTFRLGVTEDKSISGIGSILHDPLIMTRLLWDSKTDPCKFLNTALLLMARRASILESFKWDAPIELSGSVYQALCKSTSLRHLRIRLDILPSPKIGIRQSYQPGTHPPGMNHPPPHPPFVPTTTGITTSQGFSSLAEASSAAKRKKAGGPTFWANRRSFSGFRTLQVLEIVGLTSLDCLPEVADCIKGSSTSLNSLTMTLSAELARKARKPTATTVAAAMDDVSDTELDEDGDIALDVPPPPAASAPQPANEADIREEKLAQEGILATIFDLQNVSSVGKKLEKKLALSGGQYLEEDAKKEVDSRFKSLIKTLQEDTLFSDMGASLESARLEKFKMLREIADLYITGQKKLGRMQNQNHSPNAKKSGSSKLPNGKGAAPKKIDDLADETLSAALATPASMSMGLFPSSSNPLSYPTTNYMTGNSSSLDLPPLPTFSSSNGKPSPAELQQYLGSDVPSYMSPYASGPYPIPQANLSSYTFAHSPSSSGTQTPSQSHMGISFSQYPYSGGSDQPMFAPPHTSWHKKNGPVSGKHKKPKVKLPKKTESPAPVAFASSDEESENALKNEPSNESPFFAADPTAPTDDNMDVDIEHPDEDPLELGEDQEIVAGGEDVDLPAPRKRFKMQEVGQSSSSVAPSNSVPVPEHKALVTTMTTAEEMQDYIRATHGLHLEELRLHYIPLKASIVGRALDLTVLKRVTLLEVGPQEAFWTLLTRLTTPDMHIRFKSIHTDQVSTAFIKYLATFDGLEELFMHERNTKHELDSDISINTTGIRKQALQRHVHTLKRLMMRNERDDSWDIDIRTLQFLALKGKHLRELAVSLKMVTYHTLIQMFPGFKPLHALHLITLRHADRNPQLQLESLNFAVDSLFHCPGVKLKYIAIGDQVSCLETKPESSKKRLKAIFERERRRHDKKGKGKAVETANTSPEMIVDEVSDGELDDALAEGTVGERKLKLATTFEAVRDVKIFSREVRIGKL